MIIMAEVAAEKRSPDSGYEENVNVEDTGSRSLNSYTSFDNSSLLSLELNDVSSRHIALINFLWISLQDGSSS